MSGYFTVGGFFVVVGLLFLGLLQNRILKNQAKEKVGENRQGGGSR